MENKPVYYWVNKKNRLVPSNAGFIGIINSTNIEIRGSNLENNIQGILLAYTNDSIISNSNIGKNNWGVYLYSSKNNTITKNNLISNNDFSIYLSLSNNNNITQNVITESFRGIGLSYSSNNYFYLNRIKNNNEGFYNWHSSENKIFQNNFRTNTIQVCSQYSTNLWSSPKKSEYTFNDILYYNHLGNYWDNYVGNDANDDGIGDSPYKINGDYDNYPLMEPFEYYIKSRTLMVDDDLQDFPDADFITIQEAVDAATAGDTILV